MRSQICSIVIATVVAGAMTACGGGSSAPPIPPTVTLTSSAADVGIPTAPPVSLTWASTNASSCVASNGWSGTLAPSGSLDVKVSQTSTYTISCSGRGGNATASVTVTGWFPPSVSFSADRNTVTPNETVLLTWSSQNATECHGFVGAPGTMPAIATSGSQTTSPLNQTTRFQIICGNPVYGGGIAELVVAIVPPKYTVTALPIGYAVDLNDAGEVVGQRASSAGGSEVVVWIPGGNVEAVGCPGPPICVSSYRPIAMNSSRTVIGMRSTEPGPFPGLRAREEGFRWQVGQTEVSPFDVPFPVRLYDINDSGQIVAGNEVYLGPVGAWVISDGTWTNVFGADSGIAGAATAINNSGHVTGFITAANQTNHVFLYVDGKLQDLGTINGLAGIPSDINRADQIVGVTYAGRAFLYADSRFTDLGTLGGASAAAKAINDAGQIVGSSLPAGPEPEPQSHAFLHLNGTMYDLNDLVETLPATLIVALKINRRGQILALDLDSKAYLLTPVSPR